MLKTTSYFTENELIAVRERPIPGHVAILPDGNRRWALQQAASTMEGHRRGGDRLIEIVKSAKELGIKTVTFFLFSTENWARDKVEVAALMWLLETFLDEKREEMAADGIRFFTIGELSPFSENVKSAIDKTKKATADCHCIDLIFALNYGSRDEIRRACQKIAKKCSTGQLQIEEITEQTIGDHLDTCHWDDPDLFIRAGGEFRLSNYLLWQLSYAELYISPQLWPDFSPKHLLEAVHSFSKRQRRLGG